MPRRIRRLTRLEVENTLADVLGEDAGVLAQTLEADTTTTGFSTGADRGVSATYVSGLYRLARLGTTQLGDDTLGAGGACAADEESARECAKDVIRELGPRLWRRPLGEEEQTGLLAVYGAGQRTAAPDFALAARHRAGVEYIVRALVQSPSFIYRTELGADAGAMPATPVSLTAREAASAVSYGLLASPPDDELVAWAAGGGAPTEDELLRQGRRLLTAYPERFAAQAERFVREWLSIDLSSPAWAKDPVLYPLATPDLKSALDRETTLFLRGWAAAPSLNELLTAPLGYVSRKNAWIYGVPDDSPLFVDGGPEFTSIALPPSVRAGVLTLPSVLGSWAKTGSSSPVKRGVAVMKKLLCREPPPVPAQVPPLPPADQAAASTTRARYEQHTSAPACASCHRAIDPMGFAFEHYDAMGAYRETENGVAVDSRGALVEGERSFDVPDAVALTQLLARSDSVHACMVRQVYRFTSGQREGDDDRCTLESRTKQFQDAGLDVADLMVRLVATQAASRRAERQP